MSGCHAEFAAADPVELFAVNYLSVIVHLVSWVASKTISVQINYVVYNLGLNWGQESGFITERFERRVQRMSVGREKDPQTSLFIDIVFKTRSRSYKFGRTVNIFSDLKACPNGARTGDETLNDRLYKFYNIFTNQEERFTSKEYKKWRRNFWFPNPRLRN